MNKIDQKVTTYMTALLGTLSHGVSTKAEIDALSALIVSMDTSLTKAFLAAEAAVVNAEQTAADASAPLMSGTDESNGS